MLESRGTPKAAEDSDNVVSYNESRADYDSSIDYVAEFDINPVHVTIRGRNFSGRCLLGAYIDSSLNNMNHLDTSINNNADSRATPISYSYPSTPSSQIKPQTRPDHHPVRAPRPHLHRRLLVLAPPQVQSILSIYCS